MSRRPAARCPPPCAKDARIQKTARRSREAPAATLPPHLLYDARPFWSLQSWRTRNPQAARQGRPDVALEQRLHAALTRPGALVSQNLMARLSHSAVSEQITRLTRPSGTSLRPPQPDLDRIVSRGGEGAGESGQTPSRQVNPQIPFPRCPFDPDGTCIPLCSSRIRVTTFTRPSPPRDLRPEHLRNHVHPGRCRIRSDHPMCPDRSGRRPPSSKR